MPNIATVFKAEITRLARRELRENSEGLKKAVATQRSEIASLKRRVQALEAMVKRLEKSAKLQMDFLVSLPLRHIFHREQGERGVMGELRDLARTEDKDPMAQFGRIQRKFEIIQGILKRRRLRR